MKKKLMSLIIGALMVFPFAFATVNPYSRDRILYSDVDAASYQLMLVSYDLTAWNEVVVCTDKAKNPAHTVVIADLRPGNTVNYNAVAANLFASMKPAGGYDDYGCDRVRV